MEIREGEKRHGKEIMREKGRVIWSDRKGSPDTPVEVTTCRDSERVGVKADRAKGQ